jgi:hypothetical protein
MWKLKPSAGTGETGEVKGPLKDKIVPALDLDPDFSTAYELLKKDRKIAWIILRIVDKMIRVVETAAPPNGVREVQDKMSDKKCCFIVLDHRYASDDGVLKQAKLFYITYIPKFAPLDEKVEYEMQKGKNLLKAVPGAIEVMATDIDEIKRKVYAVSGTRRKTVYKDDEEVVDEDWMDE